MIVISIILIVIGAILTTLGTLIWAKKKYNLINGYSDIRRPNESIKKYARNVGIIESAIGLVWITLGTISIFASDYIAIFFIICIVSLLVPLLINELKKRQK